MNERSRAPIVLLVLLAAAAAMGGCSDKVEIVWRPSCNVCHQPRGADGENHGIEDAHPWAEVDCVVCHGGDDTAYDEALAHVQPPPGTPSYLRNLTTGELDEADPAYIQFVNPGDLRVADHTCGLCHPWEVEKVKRSMMSHTSGEITVARFRAGVQPDSLGHLGALPLTDPDFDPSIPGTVPSIERFDPAPVPEGSTSVGEYQDHYMAKACFRCHLWDFGENRFAGDFRSSGCTACHMLYANDGLSRSADPRIDKDAPPHPIRHELTSAIPLEQCTHCHYRGGRLGISYQGYRERGGAGFNPDRPEVLGEALHGHDVSYYITDEDTTNEVDETPPDLHFEAGMHCIDCHTLHDIHGDGHLYSDTRTQVETRCEDCHGDADAPSSLTTSRGVPRENLSRDEEGRVWLTKKLDGERLEVTQVVDLLDPTHARFSPEAKAAMGRDEAGFSHTDRVQCYTCHAGWIPNCYGCHVTLDMGQEATALTTGRATPGKPSGTRQAVVLHDLILMDDQDGKVSCSMPSEKFFMSVKGADGEMLIESQPRVAADGVPGMGARPFNPHTTQRKSAFGACEACHLKRDGSNQQKIDLAAGFGTDRFLFEDGNGRSWRLDAIQTPGFAPLSVSGHDLPLPAKPLSEPTVRKMLDTQVD